VDYICSHSHSRFDHLYSPERAADAATDALKIDPKSLKARYRRGVARAELHQWNGAFVGQFSVLERLSVSHSTVFKISRLCLRMTLLALMLQ